MRFTNPLFLRPRPRRTLSRTRRGFTLLETIISVSIFSIIVGGTTALLVMLLRMCNNLSAGAMASVDASLALGQITQTIRQAQDFELMDGTQAVDGAAFGSAFYAANPANAAQVAVTGVRVFAPANASSATIAVGGTSGNVTLSGTNALVNQEAVGQALDFYRSDDKGNPQPTTGKYLWMGKWGGGGGKPNSGRALVKSVAPQWNAVQFITPYMPDGVTPIRNVVTVKLTCSYYSRINGEASSDAGKGGVTQLTGECVYLRNHSNTGTTASTGAKGKNQL